MVRHQLVGSFLVQRRLGRLRSPLGLSTETLGQLEAAVDPPPPITSARCVHTPNHCD